MEKKEFAHNVKNGVEQKVSKTPEDIDLQPPQVVEVVNLILNRVASTKAELKGVRKMAKSDIHQVTKELDATKKLTDDEKNPKRQP